jgi:hypothetical protein
LTPKRGCLMYDFPTRERAARGVCGPRVTLDTGAVMPDGAYS